jgi:hypothetical protein
MSSHVSVLLEKSNICLLHSSPNSYSLSDVCSKPPSPNSTCVFQSMANCYENSESCSTKDLRRRENTVIGSSRWWNSCRRVRHVDFLDSGYDTDEGATKDSTLLCFAASGEQTAAQLREHFQQALTHSLVVEHVDKLIDTSPGLTWTRLYDSVSLV